VEPIKRWEWGNEGVVLDDDHLTWYENEGASRFASGAACDQSLDDFLKRGPHVDGVPPDILSEVNRAVREHLAKGGST
jgi:hypothetical protein